MNESYLQSIIRTALMRQTQQNNTTVGSAAHVHSVFLIPNNLKHEGTLLFF